MNQKGLANNDGTENFSNFRRTNKLLPNGGPSSYLVNFKFINFPFNVNWGVSGLVYLEVRSIHCFVEAVGKTSHTMARG